jgi:hypothetical protein
VDMSEYFGTGLLWTSVKMMIDVIHLLQVH